MAFQSLLDEFAKMEVNVEIRRRQQSIAVATYSVVLAEL
jgi:hypothetical protein